MAIYYLSPSGNDANPGTIGSPWLTIEYAASNLLSGDTLYLRGGTYRSSKALSELERFHINGLNGSSGNIITICNYPAETPVFDCDDTYITGYSWGGPIILKVTNSSWFTIKGIKLRGLRQNTSGLNTPAGCIVYDSSNWTIEQIELWDVEGYGMVIQGTQNPGGIGSHNGLVLNCDAHDIGDKYSVYGPGPLEGTSNAWGGSNGFMTTGGDLSSNITFRGCRAWRCSDDGFDLYGVNGVFTYDQCWAFWNGYHPKGDFWSQYTDYVHVGDGCGFKLGPCADNQAANLLRYVKRCIAFDNYSMGISQNAGTDNACKLQVWNNTCYDNGNTGYAFGSNYFFGANTAIEQDFKNNISYLKGINGSEITTGPNVSNNSWNGFSISAADFASLDFTGVDGARQADGSLPNINFLKLLETSTLVNAGVNVGLPFSGAFPDLGAFEFGLGGNSSPTANAGSDSTFNLPTTSVTLVGSGSDSDGSIASYLWEQLSGPSCVIVNPTFATTSVTGMSTVGAYVFRLTVTDDLGSTGTDNVTITVAVAVSKPSRLSRSLIALCSPYKAAASGDVPFPATFPTLSNMQETSSGIWSRVSPTGSTSGDGSFWGSTLKKIPSGQNGYVHASYIDADNFQVSILLTDVNVNPVPDEFGQWPASFKWCLYPAGEFSLYRVRDDGSYTNPGSITPLPTDKFGLFIERPNVIAKYYRAGVWTPITTFTLPSTLDLYICVYSVDIGAANFLTEPILFGAV